MLSIYTARSKLGAYQSMSAHGGVAAEDPHLLVLMMMDGVIKCVSEAHGCIEHGDLGRKAQLLGHVVRIVAELRGSLDLQNGGILARNLDGLYDYMNTQLIRTNADNDLSRLDEVRGLMNQIRSAWAAIPKSLHAAPQKPSRDGGAAV